MGNAALFIATVLIWGSTWIAIAIQVEVAPVILSIFHRFALAAILILGGLALTGRLKSPAIWHFVIIQAFCRSCFNFIGLYNATVLIPSGLVAVIFSLASIFNAFNARIFFGERITKQTLLAGAIGVLGLIFLFWEDLAVSLNPDTLRGVAWAALGTLIFSWGNMASRKNSALGISPLIANAWGMGIGALALLAILLLTGQQLSLPGGMTYWLAAIYLAAIGTVIGFTTYLMLVARIGSAKAGYATVLFPVIALLTSTLFEGYVWTPTAVIGVILACVGNIVMFSASDLGSACNCKSGVPSALVHSSRNFYSASKRKKTQETRCSQDRSAIKLIRSGTCYGQVAYKPRFLLSSYMRFCCSSSGSTVFSASKKNNPKFSGPPFSGVHFRRAATQRESHMKTSAESVSRASKPAKYRCNGNCRSVW